MFFSYWFFVATPIFSSLIYINMMTTVSLWFWQDQDGSHIKGLLINFIHHNWPSLLRHNFIEEFITPIIKVNCLVRRCTLQLQNICAVFGVLFYSEQEQCKQCNNAATWWKHAAL